MGYGGSKSTKSRARGKLAARKSEDFRHFLPSGGRFGGRLWTANGRFLPSLTLCSNYITDGWTDKGEKSPAGEKAIRRKVLEGEASMRPHAQKCRGFEGFDPSARASEASFPALSPAFRRSAPTGAGQACISPSVLPSSHPAPAFSLRLRLAATGAGQACNSPLQSSTKSLAPHDQPDLGSGSGTSVIGGPG
jgi:hypothetical protein